MLLTTASDASLSFFGPSLTTTDKIQLLGVIASTLTSIIAIIISIKSLRENNKMLEETNRPIISIYSQRIMYNNHPSIYLIVRNFGKSSAYMKKFVATPDFTKCYGFNAPRNYLDDLSKCVIAPAQSLICYLDYDSLTEPVHFSISYSSALNSKKSYSEEFTIDLKASVSMPIEAPTRTMDASNRIASSLESILFKGL